MAKVACVADERAGAVFPTAFAAVLRVRTRGGATVEHRIDSSRGRPGRPLTRAEPLTEFRINAAGRPDRGAGAGGRGLASLPDVGLPTALTHVPE
ncbi:hypothetical protein ACSNOI_46285 [Actinomadura kijaniata]|uniref:hypothetical protein n=1 Tax=Actinomadura kijaniata TaxID=46161 RepID=UPI003F1DB55C